MNIALYFIISFLISAIGSLPTGLITLTIMQRTLEAGKKAGYMLSFGATVMEFVYTYIALYGLTFFQESVATNYYMQVFATVVFLGFGFYNFFKESKPPTTPSNDYDYFDFGRGFLVATMNVLIIPFWLFIALWLANYEMTFDNQTNIMVFSIGSALGALAVFIGYAELGHYILARIGKIVKYTNKIVGVVFVVLGIYQLTQLF